MKFTRLEIPDVILIEPAVFEDRRGFFFEIYHEKLFAENGITARFVQDNYSRSVKGVLRGLHFQIPPRTQAKLVRVTCGEVFDVVTDIRRDSKTFGRSLSLRLSAENKKMLFIPEGFAHGFCVLSESAEFLYQVSDFYSPEHERGIIWNDPQIAVPWPKLDVPYIFSDKDQRYPLLKELKIENLF